MGSIRITDFGGLKPREHRGAGTPTRASVARDVKLWHGSLQPWRYPALKVAHGDHIGTMAQFDCCFVTSENPCASFTTNDTNCNRVFATGVRDYPTYADLPQCVGSCGEIPDLQWYRLGVRRATNPPSVSNFVLTNPDIECSSCVTGVQTKREMRAYIYSFVNKYGEEGIPSRPSLILDVDIDSEATLGFSISPISAIQETPEFIRIYRAGSGWSETGKWEESTSDFFLVEEIPYQEGNFQWVDDVPASDLGETNMSDCHYQPLDTLQGMTATDDGALVAFEGKNLWFSEPWRAHAWECHLNLDDCIVNIKVNGAYIYVATTGHPYVVSIQNNEKDCRCCREVNKLLVPAPCVSPRSMVKTQNGVMWASNAGLVQVTGGGSMQLETHSHIAEDDWLKWFPHDLQGVYFQGKYFGFNAERGFIWDMNDGIFTENDNMKFSELSLTPTAVFASRQDFLYMAFDGGIHMWDNADTFMPYTWKSRLNVEGGLSNFSAMKIVFEKWLRTRKSPNPVTMSLYADGKLVFARSVSCSRPFRLPKGYDALNWEIELSGIENVMEVHMATSMKELVLLNNA